MNEDTIVVAWTDSVEMAEGMKTALVAILSSKHIQYTPNTPITIITTPITVGSGNVWEMASKLEAIHKEHSPNIVAGMWSAGDAVAARRILDMNNSNCHEPIHDMVIAVVSPKSNLIGKTVVGEWVWDFF